MSAPVLSKQSARVMGALQNIELSQRCSGSTGLGIICTSKTTYWICMKWSQRLDIAIYIS